MLRFMCVLSIGIIASSGLGAEGSHDSYSTQIQQRREEQQAQFQETQAKRQNDAAAALQKTARGFMARQKVKERRHRLGTVVEGAQLPELSRYIIQYLDQNSLSKLNQASRSARNTYAPREWPVITFDFEKENPFPPPAIAPGPGRLWKAEKIIVRNAFRNDDDREKIQQLLEILPYFPNLRELDLSDCNVGTEELERLPRRITSLRLSKCDIGDGNLVGLQGMSLSLLDLSGIQNITGAGFNYLQRMPLRSLDLEGTSLDDRNLVLLPLHLISLNLGRCRVTEQGLRTIPRTIKELNLLNCPDIHRAELEALPPQLERLTLGFNLNEEESTLENEDLRPLGTLSLTHLTLDACIRLTHESLGNLPSSLTSLSINNCQGISSLVDLYGVIGLESLSLDACVGISVKNLNAFLSEYKNFNLKSIDLTWCTQITDRVFYGLNQIKTLKVLNLTRCRRISQNALQAFKDSHPHIRVIKER